MTRLFWIAFWYALAFAAGYAIDDAILRTPFNGWTPVKVVCLFGLAFFALEMGSATLRKAWRNRRVLRSASKHQQESGAPSTRRFGSSHFRSDYKS